MIVVKLENPKEQKLMEVGLDNREVYDKILIKLFSNSYFNKEK